MGNRPVRRDVKRSAKASVDLTMAPNQLRYGAA